MDKLKLFIELSCILTGEQNLDEQIALSYLNFISGRLNYDSFVTNFIGIKDQPDFDLKFKMLITSNESYKTIVKEIIDIWFLATVSEKDGTNVFAGKANEYEYSLLFKVIGAHPPGHTFDKTYGYWGNKPTF